MRKTHLERTTGGILEEEKNLRVMHLPVVRLVIELRQRLGRPLGHHFLPPVRPASDSDVNLSVEKRKRVPWYR